ncbi:hypothetical protein GXW82_43795 [Streptacidiphilus sp. 4-A2]|nr:hypothetical protein [Streptacidiphilus sp. 4-A2]
MRSTTLAAAALASGAALAVAVAHRRRPVPRRSTWTRSSPGPADRRRPGDR